MPTARRIAWRAVLACLAFAPCRAAEPGFEATAFDKPLSVKKVDLGPADTTPPQRKELRCSYFPAFMVKEIDEREIGDAQLSILPADAPCMRKNLPGERVLDDKQWTGYFAGAHGDFAIFSAEDGTHGGLGFAVVRPPDPAIRYSGLARSPLQFSSSERGSTLIRFAAIQAGKCSVIPGGAACAQRIGREAGVPPPDVAACKRGYVDAKRDAAREWCEANAPKQAGCEDKQIRSMGSWDQSPTVISFPVVVTLDANGATAHPEGAPTGCWPSE